MAFRKLSFEPERFNGLDFFSQNCLLLDASNEWEEAEEEDSSTELRLPAPDNMGVLFLVELGPRAPSVFACSLASLLLLCKEGEEGGSSLLEEELPSTDLCTADAL